jgi:Cu-Zn family superoxide dismutase
MRGCKIFTIVGLIAAALMLTLAGCSAKETAGRPDQAGATKVLVSLVNTKGAKVGSAILTQHYDGVVIYVKATGLTPGRHGFHIHEQGECAAPNFKSAGSHFNPFGKEHGYDAPEGHHAGDLPNLVVAEDGTVKAEIFAPHVTLQQGKPNSLLKPGGTALVIHAGADDYATDPAGNAGDRVACGVIK